MIKSEKAFSWPAAAILALAATGLIYAAWLFAFLFTIPTDGIGGVAVADGIMVNQLFHIAWYFTNRKQDANQGEYQPPVWLEVAKGI